MSKTNKKEVSLDVKEGLYNYTATVVRVIDGDTVVLDIDLGFNIHHISPCRLYGINAYELRSKNAEEKVLAKKGLEELKCLLLEKSEVFIFSKELDKYGRPLVIIFNDKNVNVNAHMVDTKLAVTYLP